MNASSAQDPSSLERQGNFREVGAEAVWSLSSCLPGYGVDKLRDNSLDTYWQSDGLQPHEVNIQFHRKTAIQAVYIYVDHKRDETYTPKRIAVKVGSTFHDLRVVDTVDLNEPTGWVHIATQDSDGRPVRAYHVQIAVLANHKNGQDTHLRQIKLYSPVKRAAVSVLPGVNFTSAEFIAFSSIR
ncbi:anaphase-promoting complex subunit 10-like [Amblyomma americanum]